MLAAQYTAPGAVSLVQTPDPECPPEGLLLRVETLGICGSDLHFCHDVATAEYPCGPGFSGHECVAIVEEGRGLPVGTRVLALAPDYNAFAEGLSATGDSVIRVPEHLSSDRAVLAQQLGTVIYCCRKLPNMLDRHVVVVGQGPAGLFFTMLLSRMGARSLTGVDTEPHRLTLARQLGATCVVNPDVTDCEAAVREHTRGDMADVVVEAVGKAETLNLCTSLVRKEGDIALFGVPKTHVLPVDVEALLRRNVRLTTSVFAQREPGLHSFRLALQMIGDGRIDPMPLVSHRLGFAEIAQGFELAHTRSDGTIKVLLRCG
ncbi:MAG: zinc-binding dehydrogenase [Bacteroidota bacterium]|nr:zinc-binding dehydrogenase [Bacteroidota bacterium]